MNILADQTLDVSALTKAGYDVTYSNSSNDHAFELVEMYDTHKLTISKNGIPQAPDGQSSIRYLDNNSGLIVAAIWTDPETGKPHRDDAPAFLYERSEQNGAAAGHYDKAHAYCCNGLLHSDGQPTFVRESSDEQANIPLSVVEENHYHHGSPIKTMWRDMDAPDEWYVEDYSGSSLEDGPS